MESVAVHDGGGRWSVGPYRPITQGAVRALVEADRLPGLAQAPAPGSAVTFVLTSARDEIVGAVCCGVRPGDGAGMIWWLHGCEDFDVLTALLAVARSHLGARRTLYACPPPPGADGRHLPGLPRKRRSVTVRALAVAGFTPAATRWYFHHPLTGREQPPVYPLAEITPLTDPRDRQLTLTDTHGNHLATAILHTPAPSKTATLCHLVVHPSHRSQGIATRLLTQCLNEAASSGATSVIAHTDQADHHATRLLTSGGFTRADTLTVYRQYPDRTPASQPPAASPATRQMAQR